MDLHNAANEMELAIESFKKEEVLARPTSVEVIVCFILKLPANLN